MSDDIKTVQMTHGEAMEALWRREQVIKRLQRENEKLRGALRPFADAAVDLDEFDKNERDIWEHPVAGNITVDDIRAAAAALKEMGDD